jgi:hypothetical protein
MDATNFDRMLKALARRTPFRPFSVELVSGDRFEVVHPEALVFRNGYAFYLNPDGDWAFFDYEGVAQFHGATNGRKPGSKKSS